MTTDEKLAAILAAVQTDPGNRGLARVPGNNLFTATAGDFQAACESLLDVYELRLYTGFFIPSSDPPAFETDGPLGALFLLHAFDHLGVQVHRCGILSEHPVMSAINAVRWARGTDPNFWPFEHWLHSGHSVQISIERAGPALDGRHYTMRGRDITEYLRPQVNEYATFRSYKTTTTIGIGDGGNEIGMGKIPHDTIVANIPNGDLIHCRVPTDHLIVAGVSNWGAYALAAGVFVLKGVTPPPDLFDPDREREILEVMVREGPLVDGVTGKQTATVDGLSWDEYVKPLVRIREILAS